MTGTLSIFGDDARVLIDPGATHSFISREYVARVGMTPVLLESGDCHAHRRVSMA